MTCSTEWTATLRVTLDADQGATSLSNWLRQHGAPGSNGAALDMQLSAYLEAVLISNSDWDGVRACFTVTAVVPLAKKDS